MYILCTKPTLYNTYLKLKGLGKLLVLPAEKRWIILVFIYFRREWGVMGFAYAPPLPKPTILRQGEGLLDSVPKILAWDSVPQLLMFMILMGQTPIMGQCSVNLCLDTVWIERFFKEGC